MDNDEEKSKNDILEILKAADSYFVRKDLLSQHNVRCRSVTQ